MSTGELTFAEAMAELASGHKVEGAEPGTNWITYTPSSTVTLEALSTVEKWRRVRPRRSRVQEMAEAPAGGTLGEVRATFGEAIVRAVCEYLRKRDARGTSATLACARNSTERMQATSSARFWSRDEFPLERTRD